MTAILAVAYKGGVLMAADSYRERQLLDGKQKVSVEVAEKIIKTPFVLAATAGNSVLYTPLLGEVFSVSKLAMASLVQGIASKAPNPKRLVLSAVDTSMRLMHQFCPDAKAEVLIALWLEKKQRGLILFVASDCDQVSEAYEEAEVMAAGEAKAWLHLVRGTQDTLPAEYQERVRMAPPPPKLDRIPENREAAEAFARSVIEWSCDLFPETCSRPIYCEAVNQETHDAYRLSRGSAPGI